MPQKSFSPPIDDRWFEDYVAGSIYEFGPVDVDEGEIVAFAQKFDPQIMHVDPVRAKQGAFGGLIASGWHTAGLMMRLAVDHYLSSVASIASPGVDELRWKAPVRPGDRLTLRVSVLETRPSSTKPDRGMVVSQLDGVNQRGEIVCSLRAMNLMFTRASATARRG
jgi:acyl dehydratase